MSLDFTLEEIKRKIPIVEALEMYSGERIKNNKMCCPIHNEKTASFVIYPKNNSFYCFGCGVGGTLIDFVMKYFGLGFNDAKKKICFDFGIYEPQSAEEQQERNAVLHDIANRRKIKREQFQKAEADYWTAFDNVVKYERILAVFRPVSISEDLHPLFIEALKEIEKQRYFLDCAECEERRLRE